MKYKFYILTAMLLSTLTAAGVAPCANDSATSINPCKAGREFTMRIPVRLPAGISAQYVWYRNGTAIHESEGAVGAGGGMVTHTVPANSAWGIQQRFYFLFRMSDDNCPDCWDSSPLYLITWNDSAKDVGCKTSGGEIIGDTLQLCANGGGIIQGATLEVCDALSGGIIQGAAVTFCNANAGGKIVGETLQMCNANDGGIIQGEAMEVCGNGDGGKIGNE